MEVPTDSHSTSRCLQYRTLKADLPYGLFLARQLLIRADGDSGTGSHDSRSLLLVIEGPERLNTTARDIGGSESLPPAASYSTSTAESPREGVSRAAQESEPNVVFYRLLTPDAASEELRRRWAELVEPPHADVVL